MTKKPSINRRKDIEGYNDLEEIALDFVWSWAKDHKADEIWEALDAELWQLLRNPWIILQTVSKEKLQNKLADPKFRELLDDLIQTSRLEEESSVWFQKKHPASPLTHIAYFSMEYMLDESLPIYSGGLGNVAGDQLKAACDLGVPVVAVGLLYQQGYFRQTIDREGAQKAFYPYNDPGQLPIVPCRRENGEWLRLEIKLPGWSVWLRAWEVKVGRLKLYLLDSNDASNYPPHRGITSELYGGDSEMRFKQELILGIGGWRLLKELGIEPEVCHLNEGHAAFAILERAKCFMKKTGENFETAFAATRAGNIFTTHTAVPAGFDRFDPFLIKQYLGTYSKEQLGIDIKTLLALGRQNPDDDSEFFNMAYLAIRGSGCVNGVSQLHGKVSRRIFQSLFSRWPEEEIPVGYVTNGVHMPSWGSIKANALWSESCVSCQVLGTTEDPEKDFQNVPDARLWQLRNEARQSLVEYSRGRLVRQLAARNFLLELVEPAKHIFDPNTLTLGFARRFATYKRPNMLLHDRSRLLKILKNAQRPVQLIIAGKAHPADKPGQDMIKEWIQFVRQPEVRTHIIFLSDYDSLMTSHLVRGVDVWINTPRRPWEACGTSGMKLLVNGGLNLSELDGWWAEAYHPEIGWAIGDGKEHGEDPAWDAAEANALYDLLEHQVAPEFYTRNSEGIPTAWISRIRKSMSWLTPRYSANRTVSEYTEEHYLPAAENFRKRAENNCALAKQLLEWQKQITQHWNTLRFGEFKVDTKEDQHQFETQVYLDNLSPQAIKVELYNNGTGAQEMKLVKQLSGDLYLYQVSVPSKLPASAYTARIIPFFPGAKIPLEAPYILWQH